MSDEKKPNHVFIEQGKVTLSKELYTDENAYRILPCYNCGEEIALKNLIGFGYMLYWGALCKNCNAVNVRGLADKDKLVEIHGKIRSGEIEV